MKKIIIQIFSNNYKIFNLKFLYDLLIFELFHDLFNYNDKPYIEKYRFFWTMVILIYKNSSSL